MFFAQAVALGVRGTIGLLVNPWEAEFGWDRAAVSLTASLGFVLYGLAPAIFGVVIMLGTGGASSPTSAVAVARWFTARRGLALGIVGAGSAAGQFVL